MNIGSCRFGQPHINFVGACIFSRPLGSLSANSESAYSLFLVITRSDNTSNEHARPQSRTFLASDLFADIF